MYSSIHNKDISLKYAVYLDDELVVKNVASHHIDSVVYSLESEGFNIADVCWDDEAMRVDLVSTNLLDEDADNDQID